MLALDSSYVLAYQHILDALNSCTNAQVWACLADSAVYGDPDSLKRRYGEAALQRASDEAAAARIETARGWVTAVPNTPRARYALVTTLYAQKQFAEGDREADMLAQVGAQASAGLLKGQSLLERGDPGGAAQIYDSLLALSKDSMPVTFQGQEISDGMVMLAGGGGKVNAAVALAQSWLGRAPFDSGNGPANLRMSKAELIRSIDALVYAEVGDPKTAEYGREIQRIASRAAGRDTVALRRTVTSLATGYLLAFLASRDSALLKTVLSGVDTAGSTTWRVTDAQLALMRGDTARARSRVERYYRRHEAQEFNGGNGAIRVYAWADLLARMGDIPSAIHAYSLLDSVDRARTHPGLQVRSWAERGALYQQAGNAEKSAEFYRKFIDAWKNADTSLQPLVDRARAALEALPGPAPVTPKRPG